MKLLIEKNILMESLNSVSKALSSRNIIPVLNGIKFDLKEEGLYLTATDNDITIQNFISSNNIKKIDEIGCSVIYGKTLLEIIRRLPDSDVLIENFEKNEVSFKTNTSIYNFNCFSVDDFPNVVLDEVKKPIKISSLKFKEIINKTSFACSLQESRPLLTGVNIKIQGGFLECTATDSYRLSKMSVDLSKMYDDNINIVIPARNINELVKTIEEDDELEMHVFTNKILFKYKNIIFQSSLLNGNYPNTDNSIAKEFKYSIIVDQKELYNTLERASLLTQSKEKNIVDVEITENELFIRASSVEMGKVEEKILIENENKNRIKIAFSAKYMLDALKMFNKEKMYILLNGEINPIILKEEDNNELIELILPMKTI
ncbi:MAG: DNA polymerase III subunit beta [Bacilli bacterium]|nr:DNA polymerase III subunit beta [Bacilli bacterium]